MSGFASPSLLVPALRNDLNMRTLETLASRLSSLDISTQVLYDFDALHPSALIHLAEQFNVLGDAGWDMASTEAQKRALLKEAIALHRTKGTRYAIRRALELLGVVATLTEWFQTTPRGVPHTFRIEAKVNEQPTGAPTIDAQRVAQIERVAAFWKPVRSHFDVYVSLDMFANVRTVSRFSTTQLLVSSGQIK